MKSTLHQALDEIKQDIILYGGRVEEAIRLALDAVETRDSTRAYAVIEGDKELDRTEVAIEEACLKVLATQQPTAIDLRLLIAVLKMNNDLERMGDLASNIAGQAIYLSKCSDIPAVPYLEQLGTQARKMVRESLNALVERDRELAISVCKQDDIADELNRKIFTLMVDSMRSDPEQMESALDQLLIGRHLERIADLATNIAEDVVYYLEGRLIQHQTKE